MRNNIFGIIAVIIIATSAYLFFSNREVIPLTPPAPLPPVVPLETPANEPPAAPVFPAAPADTSSVGNADQPLMVSITSANFLFDPKELKVKAGQTITINFKNSGFHTFTIDELGVNKQLSTDSETLTFTADKKGRFSYYCAVGSHRALGMEGVLVVE